MHALWECEVVKSVWCSEFEWMNRFKAVQGSFYDLVVRILTKPRVPEIFATREWFIWSHRNKTQSKESTKPVSKIPEVVRSFLTMFDSSRGPPSQLAKLGSMLLLVSESTLKPITYHFKFVVKIM